MLLIATVSQRFEPVDAQNGTLQARRIAIVPRKKITPDLWTYNVEKGCNLLQAMSASDKDAAVWVGRADSAGSPFQDYPGDFVRWGYQSRDPAMEFYRSGPNYYEAYAEWGLDTAKDLTTIREDQKGPNVCVEWGHEIETTHVNVIYEPTTAKFQTILNIKDGVIIGWVKFGPHFKGSQLPVPVTVLPKLKNWSDVVFLKWKGLDGGFHLKYIWSTQISNFEFSGIIAHALADAGRRAEMLRWTPFNEWHDYEDYTWQKRVDFSMETAAGKALLGSPNGRGAGHLLFQHKGTFGEKTTISHVTFYCGWVLEDDEPEMNIIFHVLPEQKKRS